VVANAGKVKLIAAARVSEGIAEEEQKLMSLVTAVLTQTSA